MANVPALKLNNGLSVPALGLGTYTSKPREVEEAVKAAIDMGYRHIDTALVYQTEGEVGRAVQQKIKDGTVKREDLFITSKLWNTYHKPDLVVKGCKKTLKNLGLDYVDLYLVHWPFAFQPIDESVIDKPDDYSAWSDVLKDPRYWPSDDTGASINGEDDYIDTWKEMERCVELGLAKSIGVSNFNSQQIERLLQHATIKPVMNQVEIHPYLNQKKLTAFCKERGILLTAYMPFTQPPRDPNLLDDPKLHEIAKEVNKTPAQVVLRYLLDLGVIPIPKSTNLQRLKENISVFDFELTDDQRKRMDEFDRNKRYCLMSDAKNHKDYPFKESVEF